MLLSSSVPRALESKTKLFGFELGDVLLVFLYLSVSNLIFGTTHLKLPLVWGGTLVLALSLHFFKRNKPENHIQHFCEFHRQPSVLSASAPDVRYQPYLGTESQEEIANGRVKSETHTHLKIRGISS
jgi:hypothetical protein